MGTDKRQVRLGGETLLERAVRRGSAAGFEVVVVGGPRDVPSGARHVPDRHPGDGPMGGIVTALAELPTPVAAVAVDMPNYSPPLLRELAAVAPAVAAVPVAAGVPQPLHAVWGEDAVDALRVAWSDGQRSLRDFLAGAAVDMLAEDRCHRVAGEERWWLSLDTPTDLVDFSRPTGRPAPSP